jgi:hypothetical protein
LWVFFLCTIEKREKLFFNSEFSCGKILYKDKEFRVGDDIILGNSCFLEEKKSNVQKVVRKPCGNRGQHYGIVGKGRKWLFDLMI